MQSESQEVLAKWKKKFFFTAQTYTDLRLEWLLHCHKKIKHIETLQKIVGSAGRHALSCYHLCMHIDVHCSLQAYRYAGIHVQA